MCEIRIVNININQLQNFSYLDSVIINNGKGGTEVWRRIKTAKKAFQNLSQQLIYRNIVLEEKEIEVHGYVISIQLHGSECWTISL